MKLSGILGRCHTIRDAQCMAPLLGFNEGFNRFVLLFESLNGRTINLISSTNAQVADTYGARFKAQNSSQ